MQVESRLVVVQAWGETERNRVTANGYGVSFWGNENVLKFTVVITAQLS